ncbi:hypothetical protein [Colwellia sp. E150_009]
MIPSSQQPKQTKQASQTTHSKIPSIIAAVTCLSFAIWSILWFWSAVLTVRPETIITEWEKHQREENQPTEQQAIVDETLANSMVARLKKSLAINPLDANSHLLLARFYEQLIKTDTTNTTNQYTQLAEASYQLATQHQPTWDYAWARLANFYSNQTETNAININHELKNALENALTNAIFLGPYEKRNQHIIIPLIFKHWSLLQQEQQTELSQQSQQAKNQITKVIKKALQTSYALLTLDSAKKYQRLKELEPLLTKQWHINRLNKYLREASNE